MSSCKIIQKPTYILVEDYPLSAKEIQPKWKENTNPLMYLVDAGLITWGFGGGHLFIPDEDEIPYNLAPVLAIGGTIHGVGSLSIDLINKDENTVNVHDDEYNKWISKYNRKYKTNYKIFKQNSNSLTIVPSRNFNEFTTLVAETEKKNSISHNSLWDNLFKIGVGVTAGALLYNSLNSKKNNDPSDYEKLMNQCLSKESINEFDRNTYSKVYNISCKYASNNNVQSSKKTIRVKKNGDSNFIDTQTQKILDETDALKKLAKQMCNCQIN